MAKMFQPTLAAKQLEFRVDLDADVPDQVVGDPDRLRQVLLNLIGNAIKFTDRGAVTVHVARDAGDASDVHHRRLRFAVRDTGIGIAAGKQQLIFESFRQADGSTTRKYGGTGLGLTICSRLVELMEGTIGVDSELGRGSTFHFTARFGIPELAGAGPALRNMAPAVAAAVAAGNGLPSTYLRILLAEDNIVNQRLASRLLEKRGHRVALASTGGEALARLKDETFDVILMDVQMPDMDGLETTAIIRERERAGGARTPIIALTAHTMKGDRERCLAVGMDGYITKPVEPADFIATVEAVAAQSTAAAEFR
jgi:CheY-like chemotaxis protein